MSTTGLPTIARYAIRSSAGSSKLFSLVISRGSVVDFTYGPPSMTKAAIVNASNEVCLGGGGVDGAISAAGGPNLMHDRLRLPFVADDGPSCRGVRCPTGAAVITGPGEYGDLGELRHSRDGAKLHAVRRRPGLGIVGRGSRGGCRADQRLFARRRAAPIGLRRGDAAGGRTWPCGRGV